LKRDADLGLAELGLRLDEPKRLTAALQVEMVPAQMAALGECPRVCEACGRRLAAKGHYRARFRSLFGDMPARVRRLFVCPCRGEDEAKSVAALDFGGDAVAPELAYVTARYAALAPFGKVAALLSELLPLGGTQHASTVRNRTLRVSTEVVHGARTTNQPASGPVVVGLDGGYVRSRHRAEGCRFEVIAGKVIHSGDAQHRFAFTRTGLAATTEAFRAALAAAGVNADTSATVLCDGMPGCGGCSARCCRAPRSCSIGGTPRCVSSTRCRRLAALARARPTRPWPTRQYVAWNGRSGACGTGAGRDAGAGSPPCAAGRGARWPASAACDNASPGCWATSSATRPRSCPMPPDEPDKYRHVSPAVRQMPQGPRSVRPGHQAGARPASERSRTARPALA